MSLVGMPLLLVFGSNAAPASAQLALTGVALTATVGSTAVLHYFTSPYVHALTEIPTDHSVTTAVATDDTAVHPELTVNVAAQLQAQTDADDTLNNRVFVAERMSILGRKKHTVFAVKDVVPQSDSSRRPFVSFQTVDTDMQYQAAQQRKTEKFYIHSHLFADKPLLQKLLGRPLKDDEKATIEELQEKYLQQKQQQKQQTPA
jgi:hypothetical protein